MTDWLDVADSWGSNAPVFATDNEYSFSGKTYSYPGVWITEQWEDPSPSSTGRICVWHYTPDCDDEGWDALQYGSEYYNEGMACDSEAEHERRVQCFQAAELLYLHAAALGNPYAQLNRGYVYSYDRCEGRYWGSGETPYPCEERAVECYRSAANAGIAESCYKLGDLLRDGRGCEMDLREAYEWFGRAYELGKDEDPVVWGSAALRLARACEEGEGCEQSFEMARAWYELATTGLGIAVRGGEQWYRRSLRNAEAGLARVRQELDGGY